MRRNSIEFSYRDDGRSIAIINKLGKTHIIRNPESIKKLKDICRKYGYEVRSTAVIENRVFVILSEFEDYLKRKKRRDRVFKALNIYRMPKKEMKLSRKNPTLEKTMMIGSLVLALSSIPAIYSCHQMLLLEGEALGAEKTDEDVNIAGEVQDDYHMENEFNFDYPDRTMDDNMDNARRYEDLFFKYANRYGLDKNLLMAIAAQESAGEHYTNIGNSPAVGIMQLESSAQIGEYVSAYNFETGEFDSFYISNEDLEDLETNIQIGAMILRTNLENANYNIPLALQTYNYGPGNMKYVLNVASQNENISVNELINNPNNTEWLAYRNLDVGDPNYIEHVFSYLDDNTVLRVKKRNNEEVTLRVINNYQKERAI